jgi:serine/threonine protein kinase
MALAAGTRLGVYEVVGLIGAGGMGEVYRAVDTRLERQVAIKVLPDAFRADVERVARFEREAKLLASLNHPNIAVIHGLEQANGEQFIVMELVEGETLADRIARGPISVDDAVQLAKQIAEALEAAHECGIIHRDLKPANVKVRDDGTVKVLDFGLAKALETGIGAASQAALTNSPTITSPVGITGVGVLLGTATYMSPEQARGKAVDKRADIWAFGCVLYEMLSGRRAFEGEDLSLTLAAVMKTEPDWSALPDVPPGLRTLLRRCLEKNPRQRIHDAADVSPLPLRNRCRCPRVHCGGARCSGAPPRCSALSLAIRRGSSRRNVPWTLPDSSCSYLTFFEPATVRVTGSRSRPTAVQSCTSRRSMGARD